MRSCIHTEQQLLRSIPKEHFQKEAFYSDEWKIKDVETLSIVLAEIAEYFHVGFCLQSIN